MFNGYLKKKTVIDAAVLFGCLGVVMILAKLYHPDNLAMHKVSPHPFFIISIVYSAYHGLRFSILSSVATAILYYALLAYQTDFQEVESIFTGAYLVLPLTTAIVSIVIGDIRQRTWQQQKNKEKELGDAHNYVELLKKEKNSLDLKLKEIKSRLVTKLVTTRSLYDRARGFYAFQPDKLFKAFQDSLKEDCAVEVCSIYIIAEGATKFKKWSDSSSSTEEHKREAIGKELEEILEDVFESETTYSIRELIFKKEFDYTLAPCLVASPIFKDGDIYAIVVVSKMPFLKLTPTNLNILESLCSWFGDSLFYSDRYNSLKNASLISRDDLIHRSDYFEKKYDESLAFSKKFKTNVSTIEISWTNAGFKPKELAAFRGLLAKTLGFLFDGLEFIGVGRTEHSLRVVLFRDEATSRKFISDLLDELSKVRANSELERFPELLFKFLDGIGREEEKSLQ